MTRTVDGLAQARRARFAALRPPPSLTVSAWADAERVLSPESSGEPGPRAPYQRGWMDALHEDAEIVVLMTAAQVGKTSVLENVLAYHIVHAPAPILFVSPTLEMCSAFSKDRLGPLLRDTPALRGKVQDARVRGSDSSATLLHKTFPGGRFTAAGANSAASLASRPIRLLLCDEIDRWPAQLPGEGDPLALAIKRTTTFWDRRIILTSTPTVKGLSRVEHWFSESDQRRFFVPCPAVSIRTPLTGGMSSGRPIHRRPRAWCVRPAVPRLTMPSGSPCYTLACGGRRPSPRRASSAFT